MLVFYKKFYKNLLCSSLLCLSLGLGIALALGNANAKDADGKANAKNTKKQILQKKSKSNAKPAKAKFATKQKPQKQTPKANIAPAANKISTHAIRVQNSRKYTKITFKLSDGNYLYSDNIAITSGGKELNFTKPKASQKQFTIDGKELSEEVYDGEAVFYFKSPKPDGSIKYSICSNNFCSLEAFKYNINPSNKDKNLEAEYKKLRKEQSFVFLILIAFVGGLVLNLMPCVLPVVALKFGTSSAFNNPLSLRLKFAMSGLGMLSFFTLLGVCAGAFNTLGIKLDWGFYFANKYFIIAMLFVLSAVTAQMLGFVTFASTRLAKIARFSPFLKGFFVAILGSSCLAPALVVAITMSLSSQGFAEPFVTLASIGCGMSLPYILIGLFGKKLGAFNPPAKVSIFAKQVLEAFLFATILWLCYILVRQNGYLAGASSSILVLSFVVFLRLKFFGKIKLLAKIPSFLYGSAALCLAFAVVFFVGKFKQELDNAQSSVVEEFSLQKLQEYLQDGDDVFVYVTADWCITCKINNLLVLNKQSTLEYFSKNNIKVLRGDLTNRNPEVSYFMHSNNSFGIPFYLAYNVKQGKVTQVTLPTLIKMKDITKAFSK